MSTFSALRLFADQVKLYEPVSTAQDGPSASTMRTLLWAARYFVSKATGTPPASRRGMALPFSRAFICASASTSTFTPRRCAATMASAILRLVKT